MNIFDVEGDSIKVAFFISSRRILSALHVFTKHYGFKKRMNPRFNKNTAIYGILHRPDNKEEKAEFRMVDYKETWNRAVLELVDFVADTDHFLRLPKVGVNEARFGSCLHFYFHQRFSEV